VAATAGGERELKNNAKAQAHRELNILAIIGVGAFLCWL
jgi:hypothetical protein